MAPVESFTQRDEQEPKHWFLLKPGEKRSTKRFPQAEINIKCDSLDFNGTVKVGTKTPEFVGVFLYENDLDLDPKPLETGEEHHFSGTQRIEIHSTNHDEHVSLRHNVAAGVIANRIDALTARAALVRTKPVVERKPILVGASTR